ncbi:hypothetical protein E5D57_011384 [Metarhizium anisopliae]|nr:hypothetical protein E5D57_011384 [Metarhizium anisopliae]
MGQCIQIEAALQARKVRNSFQGPLALTLPGASTHVARSASIVADPRAQTLKNQTHSSTGSTCGLLGSAGHLTFWVSIPNTANVLLGINSTPYLRYHLQAYLRLTDME